MKNRNHCGNFPLEQGENLEVYLAEGREYAVPRNPWPQLMNKFENLKNVSSCIFSKLSKVFAYLDVRPITGKSSGDNGITPDQIATSWTVELFDECNAKSSRNGFRSKCEISRNHLKVTQTKQQSAPS